MKLRDMMFLVIGGLLVISGMVLNTLLSGNAEAQENVKDTEIRTGVVVCETLFIAEDGDLNKMKAVFGVNPNGNKAILSIFGEKTGEVVANLGEMDTGEMSFTLNTDSKTDKRETRLAVDKYGGRFQSRNKMGEGVAFLGVGSDGGGVVATYDKFGYIKKVLQ